MKSSSIDFGSIWKFIIQFETRSMSHPTIWAISMLVTDVGDEMCWRQLWDVDDGFRRFRHQHPLSFKISVGHQHPKDVTNIEILSLTSKNCHQDKVTNKNSQPRPRKKHYYSADCFLWRHNQWLNLRLSPVLMYPYRSALTVYDSFWFIVLLLFCQ